MASHTPAPARDTSRRVTAKGVPPVLNGSARLERASAKSNAAPRMVLDLKAIEEAKQNLDRGGVTPH